MFKGPTSMRTLLHKLGTAVNPGRSFWKSVIFVIFTEFDFVRLGPLFDAGDIEPGETLWFSRMQKKIRLPDLPLEVAHSRLEERVAGLLDRGCIPFVIGGSNDQVKHSFYVHE